MQPADRIRSTAPVPSLLTSARDRTSDGFGTGPVPVPDLSDESQPPGSNAPHTHGWRTGISWNPSGCAVRGNWPQCPDVDDTKAKQSLASQVDVSPFWIYVPLACDLTSLAFEGSLDGATQDVLDAATAAGVADALWMGNGYEEGDLSPTLRTAAVDVTPGAPGSGVAVPIEDAFAVLLAEYAACTEQGGATYHVPPVLIPSVLGDPKLATEQGDLYRGPMNSVVSPGPGYPQGVSAEGAGGFGPIDNDGDYAGNDPDEAWVYITGTVEYALSPIQQASPDRVGRLGHVLMNRYESLAERQALVRFDPCCTFACLTKTVGLVVS